MSGLCKYANVFGAPNTGSHTYRIGGLAAVDLLATGGLAFLIARYGVGKSDLQTVLIVFIILILIAIPMHEAFCVNTRLNAAIFGRKWPGASKSESTEETSKKSSKGSKFSEGSKKPSKSSEKTSEKSNDFEKSPEASKDSENS